MPRLGPISLPVSGFTLHDLLLLVQGWCIVPCEQDYLVVLDRLGGDPGAQLFLYSYLRWSALNKRPGVDIYTRRSETRSMLGLMER